MLAFLLTAFVTFASMQTTDGGDPRERARQIRESMPGHVTPTDQTINFKHQVAFPATQFIHGTEFSPDGRTVYCLVDMQGIDLWGLMVSWWPEILGAAAGLVAIGYLFVLVRVRRRPQTPGAPHCRKCNYNVVSQLAAAQGPKLCPECGVNIEKSRPRRGRSTRRRLWLPTTIVALAVLGYAAMHIARLPRSGRASGWYALRSAWLDNYVEQKDIGWLLKHNRTTYRVAIVDTAAGRETGTLCRVRNYPTGGMRISPDGRFLAIGDQLGNLSWVRTGSGRTAASITIDGAFTSGYRSRFLVGFTGPDADPWVYYSCVNATDGKSRLCRWRPSTGANQVVVEETAYSRAVPARGGGVSYSARRYALLNWSGSPTGDDLPATASAPDFSESYDAKNYPIVVRDAAGSVLRSILIEEQFACTSPLLVTPDGSRAFICAASNGLVGVDLRTGERLGTLKPQMFDHFDDHMTISTDGRRLYIACGNGAFLVRDIQEARWVARLTYPDEYIAPPISASPDGRWLAATPFRSSTGTPGPGTKYTHELFLFDLHSPGKPVERKPADNSPDAGARQPKP